MVTCGSERVNSPSFKWTHFKIGRQFLWLLCCLCCLVELFVSKNKQTNKQFKDKPVICFILFLKQYTTNTFYYSKSVTVVVGLDFKQP